MTEDASLFSMLLVIAALSILLVLASAGAVGSHVADLRYQQIVGINGVRRIQSYINIRTHANRVWLGLVFLSSSVMALIPMDPDWRTWVARLLLISALVVYAISSVLDIIDKDRQMRLLHDEKRTTLR